MTDVSPTPGHESFASPSVTKAPAHSFRSSTAPQLFSQFRGPFVYNETDEERKKREEDEAKRSNFDKVRQKAEHEEAARKAAEAERDALRKEKAEREAADRKAEEEKLKQNQQFEDLAKTKEAEAKARADEAAAALRRAEEAEAKVKAFEDQQEEELKEVLKLIPADKQPPLDASDPVSKRLSHAKYALSLVSVKKPGNMHGSPSKLPKDEQAERLSELKKKKANELTADELMELAEMSE